MGIDALTDVRRRLGRGAAFRRTRNSILGFSPESSPVCSRSSSVFLRVPLCSSAFHPLSGPRMLEAS